MARIGVFLVGLMLALSIPAVAMAANTAVFTGVTPKAGSSTTSYKPAISVIVYDKYGISGAGAVSMSLDAAPVVVRGARLSGWGLRKTKLTYALPSNLSVGSHTVSVRIHDLKHKTSTYSWSFNVPDLTAPVTTSNAVLSYLGSATVVLSSSDNVGVTHTYYKLDNGATTEGTTITTSALGFHMIQFWSVDAAGNVESVNSAFFMVNRVIATAHALPTGLICTTSGCHDTDVASIHRGECAPCHTVGGHAPSNNCVDCHGADGPHDEHVVITSTSSPACTASGCHGATAFTSAHANCATCHASTNAAVKAAIAASATHCEDCHKAGGLVVPPHDAAAHAIGGGACFGNTGCHAYTDAAAFHAGTPSGCGACHTGETADTVALTVGWAARCALAGCHPDLDATHDEVFGYFSAASASSHAAGVKERFDGSEGVLLKDTEENTVTTQWDFPEVNVFWAANDPQAPASAIKGLTKDSVVTCFDCHSGNVNWLAGPHGATARWAIDANYPYPFKYAIVGGGAGANSATDYSLNVKAAGSSQTTGAATPATTTAGIPASASGIKARIAANLGTVATPTISTLPANLMITNYQNYPNYQGSLYIADATSGQYAVICAKCHDLYNPVPLTTTQADNGWGNAGPDSYEGMHGAHAGGTARNGNDVGRIDGRSDCASCHVAIPHGWSQPRLLVNGYTGPYTLGGGWVGGVLDPGTLHYSVADPYPYYQGRGMPIATGVGAGANGLPAPAVSPGNGPNDALENHEFNAFGKPVWEEAGCISCSGDVAATTFPVGLEHKGLTTEPAKLK
jgi:hypothetical protein